MTQSPGSDSYKGTVHYTAARNMLRFSVCASKTPAAAAFPACSHATLLSRSLVNPVSVNLNNPVTLND